MNDTPLDQSPSAAPQAGDDLTQIRGINRVLARHLAELGVTRFTQIADWDHVIAKEIGQKLNIDRAISRQSWIEQAALLAASADRNESGLTPVPQDTQLSTGVNGSASVAVESDTASPAVCDGSAAAMIDRQDDNLELIRGIDRIAAESLRAGGVKTWQDIASWRAGDVAWWQSVLGSRIRITKDGWIEQAAVLALGQRTRHANDVINGLEIASDGQADRDPVPDQVSASITKTAHLTPANENDTSAPPSGGQETECSAPAMMAQPRKPAPEFGELVKRAERFQRLNTFGCSATAGRRQDPETAVAELVAEMAMSENSTAKQEQEGSDYGTRSRSDEPVSKAPKGSLRQRLNRVRSKPNFNGANYAAYRTVPEEAAVEIVHKGAPSTEDAGHSGGADTTPDKNAHFDTSADTDASRRSSISRFIKALGGA